MDFQGFVDQISLPCAVVSVERTPEGNCGKVRFHRANAAFVRLRKGSYTDDMPYYGDQARDPRFEEFCFRAAFQGQRIQDYTEVYGFTGWGDITVSPLTREREDLGYCQFVIEFGRAADPKKMATVSHRTSVEVIRTAVTLRDTGGFEKSLRQVLENILEETGALAGRIILSDSETQTLTEVCSIVPPDAPYAGGLDGLQPYQLLRTYSDVEGITRTVIVTNLSELKLLDVNYPPMADMMRLFHLKSMLVTPLHRGKKILGFLYLVDFRVAEVVEIKELVELDCVFLGLEISNHALMERLEQMSRTDELTGLCNRHAMLRRLHAPGGGGPFGVFNLDLNGLKTVNDNEGHEAGDRMLRAAAELLTGVFDREDVFRTGGDEFVILCPGLSEAETLEKTELLRQRQEERGVRFALGVCWSDGSLPMADALRCADERMYEDKRDFYLRLKQG